MSRSDFQFKMDTKKLEQFIRSKVEKNVAKAAFHLRGELIESVSQEGHGLEYKVPGTKQTKHRASAEGEAPAVLFGQLRNSFAVEFDRDKKYIQAYVGVRGVPYARRLELGFTGKDSLGRAYNMQPRPYFYVTYEQQRNEIKKIMREG
ncbi:hypothetical protein BTO30_13485 [Domibacillus antri]|uniref:HK97 gp10 family phage protein n=1 Tax=Domibacillus antri TaxID=1714264 RepID=A0A1Q8Q2Y6_9BACI|nr:hypothetical protein [Domibacillus antri]OLN21710.1 hypothetical protein BTO30_13485 [Domibacillus antri]